MALRPKFRKSLFLEEHTILNDIVFTPFALLEIVRSKVIISTINYWDNANLYSQKLYTLLGAHADADFGAVTVSLWGRNLTNAKYNTFATDSPMAGQTLYFAQQGNPLQAGIDLRLRF